MARLHNRQVNGEETGEETVSDTVYSVFLGLPG